MTKFKVLVASGGFLVMGWVASAQAIDRDNDYCPTGEVKNRVTALCEGNFTGTFILIKRYYGPGYDEYPFIETRPFHRHRHFHHAG